MCTKSNSVTARLLGGKIIRCDSCIRPLLTGLNESGFETVASCCGHGKYPLTVVYRSWGGKMIEMYSRKTIPRTTKFYQKDKQGMYFIPEVPSPG